MVSEIGRDKDQEFGSGSRSGQKVDGEWDKDWENDFERDGKEGICIAADF
jgi:hypothetical protein